MTDREQIEAMFARTGIVANRQYRDVEFDQLTEDGETYPNELRVYAWTRVDGPQVGYVGFYAGFYFHDDGSLQAIGTWE